MMLQFPMFLRITVAAISLSFPYVLDGGAKIKSRGKMRSHNSNINAFILRSYLL